jgi:APA family basic amino acid/polyamine antiporter
MAAAMHADSPTDAAKRPTGPAWGVAESPVTNRLPRQLGLGTATSVVVANMIGTGIFTTTGLLLPHVEAGWMVLLAWVLGGWIALAGSLCYAELATMMPHAGGEYVYLREIYSPLAGFLTGWTSFFVGFSAPIAATAVAISFYLAAAGVLPARWLVEKSVAVAIVLVFTGVHYLGLRFGARVQNTLTGLKLLLLVGLVGVGFASGRGSWGHFAAGSDFWTQGNWGGFGVTMLLVMFAYSGWNAAAYLAEEVREPARTLPRSLALGTLAVMIIYLLVNLLFFYAAPGTSFFGVEAVGEVAVRHLFGAQTGRSFALLVALALLSSLSAYTLLGPRVYFAMARDGLFFLFAARLHPRFQTLSYSILAQGAAAAVMVLSGTFEDLLTYIGFALGIFPWMAVAGMLWLRFTQPARPRPFRVPGGPLLPVFYLGAMAWILVVAFQGRPGPSLAAIATVLAGIPVYWLTVKHRNGRTSAS